jgi:hypothetical protein
MDAKRRGRREEEREKLGKGMEGKDKESLG